jgi:hypothetical protein
MFITKKFELSQSTIERKVAGSNVIINCRRIHRGSKEKGEMEIYSSNPQGEPNGRKTNA